MSETISSNGVHSGWDQGAGGWRTGVEANWQKLDAVIGTANAASVSAAAAQQKGWPEYPQSASPLDDHFDTDGALDSRWTALNDGTHVPTFAYKRYGKLYLRSVGWNTFHFMQPIPEADQNRMWRVRCKVTIKGTTDSGGGWIGTRSSASGIARVLKLQQHYAAPTTNTTILVDQYNADFSESSTSVAYAAATYNVPVRSYWLQLVHFGPYNRSNGGDGTTHAYYGYSIPGCVAACWAGNEGYFQSITDWYDDAHLNDTLLGGPADQIVIGASANTTVVFEHFQYSNNQDADIDLNAPFTYTP